VGLKPSPQVSFIGTSDYSVLRLVKLDRADSPRVFTDLIRLRRKEILRPFRETVNFQLGCRRRTEEGHLCHVRAVKYVIPVHSRHRISIHKHARRARLAHNDAVGRIGNARAGMRSQRLQSEVAQKLRLLADCQIRRLSNLTKERVCSADAALIASRHLGSSVSPV